MYTKSSFWIFFILSFLGLPYNSISQSVSQASPLHTLAIKTPSQLQDFFQYSTDRIPFVSTHRGGARKEYPENCIPTFENTLKHTWSVLEVDPRYTKDSVIVLMHDGTLDRTSTGTGKVSEHMWEELKKLRLKDLKGLPTEYRIPTLDEALQWTKGKTVLFLDNKDVPVEARVRKIQEHNAQANAVVMAYTFEDARLVHSMDKKIMMQIFVPDKKAALAFEKTGVPWKNIIAFVTHEQPKDKTVFDYLHDKGVMCVIGSSRTVDKAYVDGTIDKNGLDEGYNDIIVTGADIIEADLGIEAGQLLNKDALYESSKKRFFRK